MHINVSPEVEHKLRELAAQCGADVADLIETLLAYEIHTRELAQAVPEADDPAALSRALAAMQHRSPEEVERARARLLAVSQPPQPLPAGQTLLDAVWGQWPGDETDAEVMTALKKLS